MVLLVKVRVATYFFPDVKKPNPESSLVFQFIIGPARSEERKVHVGMASAHRGPQAGSLGRLRQVGTTLSEREVELLQLARRVSVVQ